MHYGYQNRQSPFLSHATINLFCTWYNVYINYDKNFDSVFSALCGKVQVLVLR